MTEYKPTIQQVQFTQETVQDEFTKGKIYDTYTTGNYRHLAVTDDAGDEHLIASIYNEESRFEGDASLKERFVWGDKIDPELVVPKVEIPQKKLRISHFPQIPCKPFIVNVEGLEQAKEVSDLLARYDQFQYENRIKGDYSNITVLEEYDETEGEWVSWMDDETGIDDLDQYFEYLAEVAAENNES